MVAPTTEEGLNLIETWLKIQVPNLDVVPQKLDIQTLVGLFSVRVQIFHVAYVHIRPSSAHLPQTC